MRPTCLIYALLLAGFAAEAKPVITQQLTNQTVVAGGSATFGVAVSGIGPFTYQWQFNGANVLNWLSGNIITTVAGNGTNGYSGDNGTATNAMLWEPCGVAVDSSDNLFIADFWNNRIRKVATNGIITTVAGNGTNGYSGDNGAATNAMLCRPCGVTVDSSGNLIIADTENNRIRKVATNGIITTVAGNGSQGYFGDNGAATNAMLYYPQSVAVDSSGNIIIADQPNNAIRKVATNGIITTITGTSLPTGVAEDSNGNLFIADIGDSRVFKLATNGIITTIAGNGTYGYSGDNGAATNAMLRQPSGVTVDSSGHLFIADTYNNCIRMVMATGVITTVAGNGASAGTGGGNYSGDNGAATNAMLYHPFGVTVDSAGNLFFADYGNNRIRKVTRTTAPSLTLNVLVNNTGNYSVIISDFSGSVTSSVAKLTVVPAIITQQPQNQLNTLGSSPVFVVGVSNVAPVAYQWYLNNLTTAGATAQMLSGFVYGTAITNGGAGYTTVPQIQFIGGGGSGAGGTASITNGQVTSITMTNVGSGYSSPPSVVIAPPTGLLVGQTNATLNLNSITTNSAGGYYVVITNIYGSITSSVATMTIAYPPDISQQPQNITVGAGSSGNFNVAAAGTSPFSYQWWMTGGQQSTAMAVPVVTNGFVLGATVTNNGAGYLAVPTVQFVGGSGSSAGGYAVVSNRMVTTITMTNAGSGYTTPPTIQIAPPTAISLTGQTNSFLALLAVTNTNAGNYYVVVTNNYGSVTSSMASLIVAPTGYNRISKPVFNGGKMQLPFVGLPGTNYVLYRSSSLSPANWIPQVTNPAGVNGVLVFSNAPVATTNNFWRIRSLP